MIDVEQQRATVVPLRLSIVIESGMSVVAFAAVSSRIGSTGTASSIAIQLASPEIVVLLTSMDDVGHDAAGDRDRGVGA